MLPPNKVHLWCLFDLSKKKLYQGLLFDEARAIVTSLEADDIIQWFAWRDDWSEWRPVVDLSGLNEPIHRELAEAPPPLPEGVFEDDMSLSLSVTQVPKEELGDDSLSNSFMIRDKKRYKKRFSVTIEVSGKTFKTVTRDVSVGGVNVEDILPDWVTGYFKIRLSKPNNKQQIELQCCLVEGQAPNDRYRLMILPLQNQSDEQNLENWLAA